jgi:hypothetical protein
MPAEVIAFLSLVPLWLVSLVAHELGHVVCARLAGCVPTSFGVGLGRVLFARSLMGTRFFVCARALSGGITFTLFPQLLPGRWQRTLVFAGGILANSALAVIAFAIASRVQEPNWSAFWRFALAINLVFALFSALPFEFRRGPAALRSDGALILRTWLGGLEKSAPEVLARAETVFVLLREIGDLRALRANLVHVADMWCDFGHTERARRLLNEAGEIAIAPLPPYRAYEKLVLASIESADDNPDAGEAIAQESHEEFRAQNHEIGMFLADLVLAALAERRGDSLQLGALTDRLLGNRDALKRVRSYDSISLEFLTWWKAQADGLGSEAFVAAYESLPGRTSLMDLRLYRSVARTCARIGQHERAASAYSRALAAAKALDESFRGSDRQQFRSAQSRLLDEARDCLSKLGRNEEVARLDNFFGPPEEMERRVEAEQALATQRRYSRMLRYGLALTLLNLVAVFGLPVWFLLEVQSRHAVNRVQPVAEARPPLGPVLLWLSVSLFTAAEFVVCVPLFAISYWTPGVGRINAILVAWLSTIGFGSGVAVLVANRFFGR